MITYLESSILQSDATVWMLPIPAKGQIVAPSSQDIYGHIIKRVRGFENDLQRRRPKVRDHAMFFTAQNFAPRWIGVMGIAETPTVKPQIDALRITMLGIRQWCQQLGMRSVAMPKIGTDWYPFVMDWAEVEEAVFEIWGQWEGEVEIYPARPIKPEQQMPIGEVEYGKPQPLILPAVPTVVHPYGDIEQSRVIGLDDVLNEQELELRLQEDVGCYW